MGAYIGALGRRRRRRLDRLERALRNQSRPRRPLSRAVTNCKKKLTRVAVRGRRVRGLRALHDTTWKLYGSYADMSGTRARLDLPEFLRRAARCGPRRRWSPAAGVASVPAQMWAG